MSVEDKVIYCDGIITAADKHRCANRAPDGCRKGAGVCCFYCSGIKKCLSKSCGCGCLRNAVERYGNVFKLMVMGRKITVRQLFENGAYREEK